MNLNQALHSCISHDEIIFQLMIDYAVEGYLFWKKEDSSKVLLDASLSAKLGSDKYVVAAQLNFPHKEFLESIIRKVESTLQEGNTVPGISQATINEPVNNTHIRFSVCDSKESQSDYILVAVQSTTYFIREQSVNDISDILDVAVWQYNLSTGEVLVNEMWAQLIGYRKSELYPVTVKTFEDLTHPDDFSHFKIELENYIKGVSDVYAMEIRMRHKKGYWKWVLAKGKTVSRNEKGEVEWMMGSHIDITDRKIHETEIETLSQVPLNTDSGVLITNCKGEIIFVNAAFEKITGYRFEEVINKKPGDFLQGPLTEEKDIIAFSKKLSLGKPFIQEILNYTKQGRTLTISCQVNPIYDQNGEISKYVSIQKDITEDKHNQSLLKESEERLRFVLKGSELGYWDWEADSGKMTVNDRWYEMLGYTREDFDPSIKNWHALVHAEDMAMLHEIMETTFPGPTKSEFAIELRARHKNGEYVWILDRGAVVERNGAGQPQRISGMHMLINQRKKLEKDLEEEREFLNKIISASVLSVIIINKSGEITFANAGAESILGLKKNEIESRTYNDPGWKQIKLDGTPVTHEEFPFVQVMTTKKAVKDSQFGIIWQDGTIKYISVTGAPLNYDKEVVEDVIFSVTDITERVLTQQQLDQTKNQMQSILKDLSDVVWSVNLPSYKMKFVTPSIEKLTGYPPSYYLDQLVSDCWEQGIYKPDKYLLENAYANLRENGSFETEYRIKTKVGVLKWVLVKGTIISNKGIPSRLDGYIADISDRKEQENSLKKYVEIVEDQNDRLKNFTYIVSHNLRSHSANIQGLMYLINNKHPELAENEFIKMLNKASNKLDDTLHHLNNVVSVVSSTEEIKKVNLGDAITAFLDTFENLISEAQVYFLNEVSQNVLIEAVPAFFESIITNLLTNAIKYRDTEKSESYVRISNRSIKGIVIIEIEDNGLGIDLDKYGEKLFGMYKTFHNHKDSRGLGLFLTRNQVESMGGKIEVESTVGKGSIFKVFLKDGSI